MRGAPVVKRLREPRVVVTPEVKLEVVVRVILKGLSRQASISAALVVIRVAGRRLGADPLLLLVRGAHATKVDRHLCYIVHVVGEKENCVTAFPEEFRLVSATL